MPVHPFGPVFSGDPTCPSRVLILGSFPSVASRGVGFFYGHPRNRFWPTLAAVLDLPEPRTVPEKRALLLSSGIALYDAVASCDIRGSADASISRVVPTDLSPIFQSGAVRAVFANGATAFRLYRKYHEDATGQPAILLPSTSPANARMSAEQLTEAWRAILAFL